MVRIIPISVPVRGAALLAAFFFLGGARGRADGYTRLLPLPPPAIAASAPAQVGRGPAEALVDGNPRSEYISDAKGIQTFVEFDFGAPTALAGFRFQDRRSGTIAGSELIFFDAAGSEISRLPLVHPDKSGAVVFRTIWPALVARRVRWQVTKLGADGNTSVGGAEATFYRPGAREPSPRGLTLGVTPLPISTPAPGGITQPLQVTIDYPYAEPLDATLQLGDRAPRAVRLEAGAQTVAFSVPVSAQERSWPVTVADGAKAVVARRDFTVPPFRQLTIYILPHSHVDIGFTEQQSAIEEKQVNNLLAGIAAARRTADYPPGARFVWNLEGLWPADLLLRRLNAEQQRAFVAAVRQGQVALNGMYFNVLTGLCRPEELIQLFRFGTQLRARTGATLDSAMISDVPGYTWGSVTAMSQAGIKYFSAAPNYFDRIGDIMVQWENKPFWWIGPSGHERVLVWVPSSGYALSHIIRHLSPQWITGYAEELTRTGYPYDVAYIRWSGLGDNGVPDPSICDFVREWNAAHAWPHFVIGSVHDAFQALERKHGAQLPQVRGDWTPYWEDGAGSSALETGMNRASSDRLAQAEALWALRQPASYPAGDFTDAMRHVLRYDEHTWGASTAITVPNSRATLEQWSIKHGEAATADILSRDLLARALSLPIVGDLAPAAVDIFNLNSWARTGLATLSKDISAAGDLVRDDQGRPVPSQRLTSGELAVLARDIPPFSSRRYTLSAGQPFADGRVRAAGTTLENGAITVGLDPKNGGIVELRAGAAGPNLADPASGQSLNEYLYFNGSDPATARSNEAVTIRPREKGPLVASLVVESAAPGCYDLAREITLVAGEDHVEVSDFIDKQRLVAKSYRSPEGKESVNFVFPFQVPDGQVRLEVPFGVIRPDADQIPGACKNWFSIDRWADVSNSNVGVTWVSLDTPLVEVGGLTANLLNSQTNPDVWRKRVGPTQKLYAWVMNNHWGTNYRAYQEGPVTFRFVLRPHGAYDPTAASRLAIGASQPLLAVRAHGTAPASVPRLSFDSPNVIVTGIKPSDDGRAVIVRLWGASEHDVQTRLHWSAPRPSRVWLSDTSEAPVSELGENVAVPAWGVVTLRAELP